MRPISVERLPLQVELRSTEAPAPGISASFFGFMSPWMSDSWFGSYWRSGTGFENQPTLPRPHTKRIRNPSLYEKNHFDGHFNRRDCCDHYRGGLDDFCFHRLV